MIHKDVLMCNLMCSKGFPSGSDSKVPAMQETWVRSLGWEDPLGKEMATHYGILAWNIPCVEEPGGLQTMGSPRVAHTEQHHLMYNVVYIHL